MTSTSDGSQAEEQAKAFARQYAKEFQAEMEEPIDELFKIRKSDPFKRRIRARFKI